jgi:hypothetical protein
MRACRIDKNPIRKSGLIDDVPKHAFRRGRAADISHAHEKYADL